MWQLLQAATATFRVLKSLVIAEVLWQSAQLISAWLINSWRNVPAEARVRQASSITRLRTPILAASAGSKSGSNLSFGLWQVAQFVGPGSIPLSCEWQVKHAAWLIGDDLNVPFLSQKASPISSGGFVKYSSSPSPCGSIV